MNKKLVKECIKRINIHAFKYLTGNTAETAQLGITVRSYEQ